MTIALNFMLQPDDMWIEVEHTNTYTADSRMFQIQKQFIDVHALLEGGYRIYRPNRHGPEPYPDMNDRGFKVVTHNCTAAKGTNIVSA
ncbi:hypothetical protein [Vibrio brasiliensis]|uniref:hypothetical protein n=1 Tax=Vibrio brasiliensis TaxID=170652 RepID=UPI001EFE3A8F|nr:hypothetical protein [Vibrio brasiliensis]MCG9727451.1 hypothetical protein [Vibrio brasiliensis]